jgi:hypothetical protein
LSDGCRHETECKEQELEDFLHCVS